jgi:hypothetical protein
MDYWIKAEDGFTYATLNDRRLVQFRDQEFGARVIASDLPSGKTLWMDRHDDVVYAVKQGASQRPTRLLSVKDGQLRIADLVSGGDVVSVHRYGDVILLIRVEDVRAHSLSDGRLLERLLNPHRWLNGRYFKGQDHFYFAAWNGESIRFEPVILPRTTDAHEVLRIFDRPNSTEPWMLQKDGNVVSMETLEKTKFPEIPDDSYLVGPIQISNDGGVLLLTLKVPDRKSGARVTLQRALGLRQSQHPTVDEGPSAAYLFNQPPSFPVWNIFRVVESVARLPAELAICGRKDRWRSIGLLRSKLSITQLNKRVEACWQPLRFKSLPKPTPYGCTLHCVEWPCGSKAWLDSRGLLHLKSHDPKVPEISLVLSDREVAGWTSDGFVCGPKFFLGEEPRSEPAKVYERLEQFLHLL